MAYRTNLNPLDIVAKQRISYGERVRGRSAVSSFASRGRRKRPSSSRPDMMQSANNGDSRFRGSSVLREVNENPKWR